MPGKIVQLEHQCTPLEDAWVRGVQRALARQSEAVVQWRCPDCSGRWLVRVEKLRMSACRARRGGLFGRRWVRDSSRRI